MAENSQIVATLTAATATPLHWAQWYSTLVVDNSGTAPLFARTDGTPATGASGDIMILAGQTKILSNAQAGSEPDLASVSPYQPGWTAQQNRATYASTFPTYISLYSVATTTTPVAVTAQ